MKAVLCDICGKILDSSQALLLAIQVRVGGATAILLEHTVEIDLCQSCVYAYLVQKLTHECPEREE